MKIKDIVEEEYVELRKPGWQKIILPISRVNLNLKNVISNSSKYDAWSKDCCKIANYQRLSGSFNFIFP